MKQWLLFLQVAVLCSPLVMHYELIAGPLITIGVISWVSALL